MSKILPIIHREYITRVRKRSFLVMCLLGPLLFAVLLFAPFIMAGTEGNERQTLAVVEVTDQQFPVDEEQSLYKDAISGRENLRVQYLPGIDTVAIKAILEYGGYDGVLVLTHSRIEGELGSACFYECTTSGLMMEPYLRESLNQFCFQKKLLQLQLTREQLNAAQIQAPWQTRKWENVTLKQEEQIEIKRGLGYAASFLIYFFIFFFGAQVMRGVVEEKTNRIVELLITSVRPFELMMGKILGIALVGLTQFLIWMGSTLVIYRLAQMSLGSVLTSSPVQPGELTALPENGMLAVVHALQSLEVGYYLMLLGCFVFYFIFGYLLYASLFAAIGAAVDSETDTQQFMLPVTIPLILGMIVMISALTNPASSLAFWFSLIPFTSPVVMMARVPFGVAPAELAVSMGLLAGGFLAVTWMAGKIYRSGILHYGKKLSYRELARWTRFKK